MKPKEKLRICQEEIIEKYRNGQSGCILEKEYDIPRTLIYKMLKTNNIKSRTQEQTSKKYEIDDNLFKIIDCEWKAYFLGFLYADGYVTEDGRKLALRLNKIDKKILDIFNDKIFNGKKSLTYIRKKEAYELYITNKTIVTDIINLGCFNNKTFTLKFPTPDQVPECLLNHFVRGYFDGDGCIEFHVKNNKIRKCFSMVSSQLFIDKIYNLFISLDIKCYIFKHLKSDVYYIRATKSKSLKLIYEYLYKFSTISLDRKYEKFKIAYDYSLGVLSKKSSKYEGIYYDNIRKKWVARKNNIYVGRFDLEDEAISSINTVA